MRAPAVLLVVALQACSSGPDPADELHGSWMREVDTDCMHGLRFAGRSFRMVRACRRAEGISAEVDEGRYEYDGETLQLQARRTTCLPYSRMAPITFQVNVSADSLQVREGSRIAVFARTDDTGSAAGGVIRLGCWKTDGSFVPMEPADVL